MFNRYKFMGIKLVYVRVHADRLVMRNVEPEPNSTTVYPEQVLPLQKPVSEDATAAAAILKTALRGLHKWWELLAPILVIQTDFRGEKLTEDEFKPIGELASKAGASRVFVLQEKFHDLKDEEVRQFLFAPMTRV